MNKFFNYSVFPFNVGDELLLLSVRASCLGNEDQIFFVSSSWCVLHPSYQGAPLLAAELGQTLT